VTIQQRLKEYPQNSKLYTRVKFFSGDGKDLDNTNFTAITNNFLHYLFSQCNVILNGVPITQAGELYQYRSYHETLMNYGTDVAITISQTLSGI